MTRTAKTCRRLALAALCVAAAGCMSTEAMNQVSSELDRQFVDKTREINTALGKISDELSAALERSSNEYEDFRKRLVQSYNERQKPAEPTFFAEDAWRRGTAAKTAPAGPKAVKTAAAPTPVPEVHSELLSERTLEHRGLRLLWKLALDGSGVRTADVDRKHLYLITKRNRLYSVELKTGLTQWVVNLRYRPDGPPGFSGDYVVISAGDIIHVIDKSLGQDKWRFETKIQPSTRPFCDEGGFVFGCWDGRVCGFQFGDRHPRWQFRARNRMFAAPFVRGGYAYAVADNGICTRYHASERLAGRDIPLGGRPVGDLLGTKNLMYIGTENFEMVALRTADGTKGWGHACNGRVLDGPWLSSTGNVLYYSARDDGLYALTSATGKTRWRIPNGVRPVAAHGAHLFLLRTDGTICKVDAGTGNILWSESSAPFVTVVGHMHNEVIYLISADGQVFAVAPKK